MVKKIEKKINESDESREAWIKRQLVLENQDYSFDENENIEEEVKK